MAGWCGGGPAAACAAAPAKGGGAGNEDEKELCKEPYGEEAKPPANVPDEVRVGPPMADACGKGKLGSAGMGGGANPAQA